MAYQSISIDAMLAEAVGDDPALMDDLRLAFVQSAQDHLKHLADAPTLSEWHMAAWRFKGLCATFGVDGLADLAAEATEAARGDPSLLRRMHVALAAIAAG